MDPATDAALERRLLTTRNRAADYICRSLGLLNAWAAESSTPRGLKDFSLTPKIERWADILCEVGNIVTAGQDHHRAILLLISNLVSIKAFCRALTATEKTAERMNEMLKDTFLTEGQCRSPKTISKQGTLLSLKIIPFLPKGARRTLVDSLEGERWVRMLMTLCDGFLDDESPVAKTLGPEQAKELAVCALKSMDALLASLHLRPSTKPVAAEALAGPADVEADTNEKRRAAVFQQLEDNSIFEFAYKMLCRNGVGNVDNDVRFTVSNLLIRICEVGKRNKDTENGVETLFLNDEPSLYSVMRALLRLMGTTLEDDKILRFGTAATALFNYGPSEKNAFPDDALQSLLQDSLFAGAHVHVLAQLQDGDAPLKQAGVEAWCEKGEECLQNLVHFVCAVESAGLPQLHGGAQETDAIHLAKQLALRGLAFCLEQKTVTGCGGQFEDDISLLVRNVLLFLNAVGTVCPNLCATIFDAVFFEALLQPLRYFSSPLVIKRVQQYVEEAKLCFRRGSPVEYHRLQQSLFSDKRVVEVRERTRVELEALRLDRNMPWAQPQRPLDHFCPLSRKVMVEPVNCADGRTYERTYIEQFLQDYNGRSPFTDEVISREVHPNDGVRNWIEGWELQNHVVAVYNRDKTVEAMQQHLENDAKDQLRLRIEKKIAKKKKKKKVSVASVGAWV